MKTLIQTNEQELSEHQTIMEKNRYVQTWPAESFQMCSLKHKQDNPLINQVMLWNPHQQPVSLENALVHLFGYNVNVLLLTSQ